jgi:hypothetical protein
MTLAMGIQGILLEAGVFVGACAAGLGACGFFMKAAHSVRMLPGQIERCACAMEHSVVAMEKHNSLGTLVLELRNLVVATRDDLNRERAEHDMFRREIRILSRRMEGQQLYAQITD